MKVMVFMSNSTQWLGNVNQLFDMTNQNVKSYIEPSNKYLFHLRYYPGLDKLLVFISPDCQVCLRLLIPTASWEVHRATLTLEQHIVDICFSLKRVGRSATHFPLDFPTCNDIQLEALNYVLRLLGHVTSKIYLMS